MEKYANVPITTSQMLFNHLRDNFPNGPLRTTSAQMRPLPPPPSVKRLATLKSSNLRSESSASGRWLPHDMVGKP